MAERKAAKKGTQQSAKNTSGKASKGFTDEERAAMKERAQELKAEARRGPRADKDRADGERAVLDKIAEMPETDRVFFDDRFSSAFDAGLLSFDDRFGGAAAGGREPAARAPQRRLAMADPGGDSVARPDAINACATPASASRRA